MTRKTSSYREALLESLADPTEAANYLNAAISDSPDMFRKALRNVAQARQMAKVAREAGVTRESLYRATSDIGNPTLDTLDAVLTAVGVKIRFEADETSDDSAPPHPDPTEIRSTATVVSVGTSGCKYPTAGQQEGPERTWVTSLRAVPFFYGITSQMNAGRNFGTLLSLEQGNEGIWQQTMKLQPNPDPPSNLRRAMISPQGTPTTYNSNQLFLTSR
jgi:probable addiction module antidote protein